jgi:hypothetical protein
MSAPLSTTGYRPLDSDAQFFFSATLADNYTNSECWLTYRMTLTRSDIWRSVVFIVRSNLDGNVFLKLTRGHPLGVAAVRSCCHVGHRGMVTISETIVNYILKYILYDQVELIWTFVSCI